MSLYLLAGTVAAFVAAVLLTPMTANGMRRLYAPLVEKLVGGDDRCSVEQPSTRVIVVRLDTRDGTTTFTLQARPAHLDVRWTNESPETGRLKREWTFFKLMPQSKMVDRIHDDLLVEHRTMMRS